MVNGSGCMLITPRVEAKQGRLAVNPSRVASPRFTVDTRVVSRPPAGATQKERYLTGQQVT